MSQLALTLRPQALDDLIGNQHVKKAIASWVAADNFPNSQLYIGPVGCGKSSVAEIVARLCQGPAGREGADIRQINAGTVGKVDDMRELIDSLGTGRPFAGRFRVVILEEAHRATDNALDALLVPMETNPWVVWILTSSEPAKLLPAIRSRCSAATFEMKPLTKAEITDLVYKALPSAGDASAAESAAKFGEWLWSKGVTHGREILGVLDQHLSGVPLEQCVQGSEHEPLYKEVAAAVFRGDWDKTRNLLEQIKTADYRGMVAMVSAYLAGALLKEPQGARGDALASCLVNLGNTQFADGVAYAAAKATFYKTCRALSK